MKHRHTKEQLESIVQSEVSYTGVMNRLGIPPKGGNHRTIKLKIVRLGIDTSHFTGQGHMKGKSHSWSKTRKLEEVLVENSDYNSTSTLKKRLIKSGILEDKCNLCGINSWLGKPLVCHLDHINGINNDNRLENLRLLCPNCHSQTDTYCGKNKNNHGQIRTDDKLGLSQLPLAAGVRGHNNCIDCDKPICRSSIRCKSCAIKAQHKYKIEWPSDEDLRNMVEESSYIGVGRKLGVSDNAVRKRLNRNQIVK